MKYWTYTAKDYEELNKQLRLDIDIAPIGQQSQKQASSHYDGYNHKLSWNAQYPEFQESRIYKTWSGEDELSGYIYNEPPPFDNSPSQAYKHTFWPGVAPLVKQFAKEVAVREETLLNHHIIVDVMWFHRMDKGDYDNWHNHSHSQWIGVYYIDLPEGEATLFMDYDGKVFQPKVKAGQLLIFPSGYIHKSPDCNSRKAIVSFNFNVASKYSQQMIEKVQESHPNNFFGDMNDINRYK
jgi:hypothetical protein|tara:strand:- start:132 stop:845 length:714 start_codon:yes stop_codon:yes gene_type:complete